VADGDTSTCGFAEFSSKWQTRFSHLRGGSYNHAVVQILTVMLARALGRWTRGTPRNLSFTMEHFQACGGHRVSHGFTRDEAGELHDITLVIDS
jgi:hypothetical protein